jgi:hypothetical protein
MKNQQTITLPLVDLIRLVLGNGYWHYRPIPRTLALTVEALTKNQSSCYIQWTDRNNEELDEPILWDWAAWQQDCVGWERSKVIAHKARVERFLLEDNVNTLLPYFYDFTGIEGDRAKVMLTFMLVKKQYNHIRVFYKGVIKTKEEEL